MLLHSWHLLLTRSLAGHPFPHSEPRGRMGKTCNNSHHTHGLPKVSGKTKNYVLVPLSSSSRQTVELWHWKTWHSHMGKGLNSNPLGLNCCSGLVWIWGSQRGDFGPPSTIWAANYTAKNTIFASNYMWNVLILCQTRSWQIKLHKKELYPFAGKATSQDVTNLAPKSFFLLSSLFHKKFRAFYHAGSGLSVTCFPRVPLSATCPLGEATSSKRFDLKPPRCPFSISFSLKSKMLPRMWTAWPKSWPSGLQERHKQHKTSKPDALTLISPFAACHIFMVPSVLVDTPSPPPLEISRQVICRKVKAARISFI